MAALGGCSRRYAEVAVFFIIEGCEMESIKALRPGLHTFKENKMKITLPLPQVG